MLSPWVITPLNAYQDNYIWVIQRLESDAVWVVDPGEAAPVLAFLEARSLQLAGILITHHHWDHCRGIDALVARFKVPVYGSSHSSITQRVHEGDHLLLAGLALPLQVLAIPGHTLDHLAYYNEEAQWLFCGDTLFSAGCGRLFEGTAAQMLASLTRLAALPPQTAVYCGHEYTAANLRFALQVEPHNSDIGQLMATVTAQRAQNHVTLPSSIALEKRINPFLRVHEQSVINAAENYVGTTLTTPEAVFAVLRAWKNVF